MAKAQEKLKDCKLIEENGKHYLYLIYERKSEHETREIHIPRLPLAIECMPKFEGDYDYRLMGTPDFSAIFADGNRYRLKRASIQVTNYQGETFTLKNTQYADVITEQNPVEMTLEEIEKKLGHKVKVVSEK